MYNFKEIRISSAGFLLSSLLVGAILAACSAPNEQVGTSPTSISPTIKPTTPAATKQVTKSAEKPQYGGTFTMALASDQRGFDSTLVARFSTYHNIQSGNTLLEGDWSKGPAGDALVDFSSSTAAIPMNTGSLAEKWELVGGDTIVYHIRQGVRWGLNPDSEASRLAGGREMTSQDVAWSIRRSFNMVPGLSVPKAYSLSRLTPDEYPIAIEATDRTTVVIKGRPGFLGSLFYWTAEMVAITPPEVVEKYGDLTKAMTDVGTGAFMMQDYVPASSITLMRNPNYWQKDPVGGGKGNQLPYLDGVRFLIIPDWSTRLAAFRTGKIHHLMSLSWEDYQSMIKNNPDLDRVKLVKDAEVLGMRVDRPEQPWHDKRVRQALQMALDRKTIVQDYFHGEAELVALPASPSPLWKSLGAFPDFDTLPADVKALFEYNPSKAKQLLAEAGYPQGFKMEVILDPTYVDAASIVKEQMARVGVALDLAVRETSVYTSIRTGRTHKDAIWAAVSGSAAQAWHQYRPTDPGNYSMIDDPVVNRAIADFAKYFMTEDEKSYPIIGQVAPYILEQSWYLQFPAPYSYTMWWPWVKGYHGEFSPGGGHFYGFAKYVWIDRNQKTSMGF